MSRLFLLALAILGACTPPAGSGQLGLPTERPSSPARSASAEPARSASVPPSASPPATPSASQAPSPSVSPTVPASPSPTTAGTAVPTSAPARPGVVAASATQVSLTFVYSAPMRAAVGCGGSGAPPASGQIDDPTAYVTADRVLEESLRSSTRVAVNADCTTVTFVFGIAAAAGAFTVTPTAVQDVAGVPIDPARASARVAIGDLGRPEVVAVEASANIITISFGEPMLEFGEGGGVRLAGNYRIDGKALVVMTIVCLDAGCRTVRIQLVPGALVAGTAYTLAVANVVDRAGRNITPDPTTLTFVAR